MCVGKKKCSLTECRRQLFRLTLLIPTLLPLVLIITGIVVGTLIAVASYNSAETLGSRWMSTLLTSATYACQNFLSMVSYYRCVKLQAVGYLVL